MAWEKRDLFQDFLRDVSHSLEEYSEEEVIEESEKPYLIHLKPTDCADYRILDEEGDETTNESDDCSCSNSSKTSQSDDHGKAIVVTSSESNSGKATTVTSSGSNHGKAIEITDDVKIIGEDETESDGSRTTSSGNSCSVSDSSRQKRTLKTKLRKCLLCKQSGYLLENGITKLVFADHLESKDLSLVFSAVEEPWIVSSVRVRSGGLLDELPKTVSRFDHLTTLTVRHNHLEDLPMSLKTLVHLRNLDIAHNKFNEVPSVIYLIKPLMNVNLKDNNIRFISSAILDLRHLKSFDVSLNPMVSPPRHICDKGVEAILEQIRSFSKKRLETYVFQTQ